MMILHDSVHFVLPCPARFQVSVDVPWILVILDLRLMSLALDLSSAIKVTSMREELWLVDGDEGRPCCYSFRMCMDV